MGSAEEALAIEKSQRLQQQLTEAERKLMKATETEKQLREQQREAAAKRQNAENMLAAAEQLVLQLQALDSWSLSDCKLTIRLFATAGGESSRGRQARGRGEALPCEFHYSDSRAGENAAIEFGGTDLRPSHNFCDAKVHLLPWNNSVHFCS